MLAHVEPSFTGRGCRVDRWDGVGAELRKPSVSVTHPILLLSRKIHFPKTVSNEDKVSILSTNQLVLHLSG